MPAIKWSNYKITTTASGEIVIGKLEAKQPVPGLSLLSDKSEERTDEAVKAVMQHMNSLLFDDPDKVVKFQIPGFGTLSWSPEEKEES